MVAKRTSVSSSSPGPKAGRPSKAAKVTPKKSEEKVTQTVGVDEFRPVKDLMSEFCVISGSCVDMLSASLPLALKTKKEERHTFEITVINSFEAILADADKECKSAIEAAEESVRAHEEAKASSTSNLEAAQQAVEKALEQKTAAEGHHDEKHGAHKVAANALKEANQALEVGQKAVQDQSAAKEAFDKEVAEVVPPLKEGFFAPKEWRKRQAVIARLSVLLKESKAPESMVMAAQLAFKDKPEARGEFAAKTVEATEACLASNSTTLEQAISEATAQAQELETAAATRAEGEKAAKNELEEAQEAMFAAQNEHLDAGSEVTSLQTSICNFNNTDKKLEAQLLESKASFERFQELSRQFESLRDSAPEAEEEASADAPAQVDAAAAPAEAQNVDEAEVEVVAE